MNEKALQYAYELFQADGYTDSIDNFKNLINTNPDAFNYSFELFQADGYKDSVEDFATLLGVKKKKTIWTWSHQVSAETLWVQILGLVVWNRQCWTKSSELNKIA